MEPLPMPKEVFERLAEENKERLCALQEIQKTRQERRLAMSDQKQIPKPKITTTTELAVGSAAVATSSTQEDSSSSLETRENLCLYVLPMGARVPFYFLSHKAFLPFFCVGALSLMGKFTVEFFSFPYPEPLHWAMVSTCFLAVLFGITLVRHPYPKSVLEKIPTILKEVKRYNDCVRTFATAARGNKLLPCSVDISSATALLDEKRRLLQQLMGFLREANVSDQELDRLQGLLGVESTFPRDLLNLFEDAHNALLGGKKP